MTIKWYLNRLRSMSSKEIGHRISERIKKSSGRWVTTDWGRYADATLANLPELAAAVDAAPGYLATSAKRSAKLIMSGRFSALGADWPTLDLAAGSRSMWHLDPITEQYWPSGSYCLDIGYRHAPEMGDIKYVWEFSRLQFLQPVAVHARLSGDSTAIEFIERAIGSWHASNPPFRGTGWSSGIELSLRAISLLVVTSLVGNSLGQRCRQQVNEIIRAHALWLARYPSRFSSANNHLVAEDAALYLIGITCPFVDGAERLRARAESGLTREAGLQIFSDGVAAEQSPTYGALTSELLLLCAWVGERRGEPMAASVSDRLAAFAEWVFWLARTDGTVPAIGDDDEGRVLTLGEGEPGYATSVAAAVAAFTRHEEHVPPFAATFRNALLPAVPPAPRPTGTRSFAEGGYTIYRGAIGEHHLALAIDHGPLGYLSLAAHGHADALSFVLSIDEKAVLVDPGTYLYHSGYHWRDWFRNTRAHNTVSVGGAEQSIISGSFNWSHKARAQLEKVEDMPFALTASHDGYMRRFGVRHRRQLSIVDGALQICDTLEGGFEQAAEIVLQLAPDCETSREGAQVIVHRDGARVATITFPSGGMVTHVRGERRVDGGWVSPRFGVKVPATRLSWSGKLGNQGVITRIKPG